MKLLSVSGLGLKEAAQLQSGYRSLCDVGFGHWGCGAWGFTVLVLRAEDVTVFGNGADNVIVVCGCQRSCSRGFIGAVGNV